ncbi:MAG TPA: hypothetical protein DEQ09_00235 [Bacteroidales bacterium]|nr:hypothetical protein [Bacteroidales bacterium]
MRSHIIKYILTVLLAFTFSVISSNGQYGVKDNNKPPLRQRLTYGGSFGLQFGTITNIELSPVIGVWLLPRLSVAAGPTWQYYKDPYGMTSIYGGRSFTRFMFIQDMNEILPLGLNMGFYLHGEYQALSLESDFWSTIYTDNTRIWLHTMLAGAGISQPMGMRSSFNITFMWALTESQYKIYSNPEIRIDFLF